MDSALHDYNLADDYFSLVRIYCFMENIQNASEIATVMGIMQLYSIWPGTMRFNIKLGVHFYTRAQTCNSAINLYKKIGLDGQLMNLAQRSSPEDMMEAACYFEENGIHLDRAVTLYHKAGYMSEALALAASTQPFPAIQLTVEDLKDQKVPPSLGVVYFSERDHDRGTGRETDCK